MPRSLPEVSGWSVGSSMAEAAQQGQPTFGSNSRPLGTDAFCPNSCAHPHTNSAWVTRGKGRNRLCCCGSGPRPSAPAGPTAQHTWALPGLRRHPEDCDHVLVRGIPPKGHPSQVSPLQPLSSMALRAGLQQKRMRISWKRVLFSALCPRKQDLSDQHCLQATPVGLGPEELQD